MIKLKIAMWNIRHWWFINEVKVYKTLLNASMVAVLIAATVLFVRGYRWKQ